MESRLNLNLIAPVNRLGYGQTGYYLTKELKKLANVHLTVLGKPEQSHTSITEAIKTPHFKDAPCIRLWHQNDMKMFIGNGKHIGFPIFELDTFTDLEKHHLNGCDELFVCSHWAQEILIKNDIKVPSHVIPLGVDTSIFNPSRSNPVKDKTIFFNCGKWEVRKGHPELAQAWHKAFKPEHNVELWLMCDNPFYPSELTEQFRNMFLNGPMGHKVRFIPGVESHLQVAKIMGSAHIGIFPSKAEGWNLELLEMMAMGKEVVAASYAGQSEFCNKENTRLLYHGEMEPAYDGIWFKGQGNWLGVDVSELVETMQVLHSHNSLGCVINDEGIETAKRFTWENSAKKILDVLNSK